MRLDHIAYRVTDRKKTAAFFCEAFGYKVQDEFTIYFDDEKTDCAQCIALEPPEKVVKGLPWQMHLPGQVDVANGVEYHMAPEIFVSDGSPGSIVGDWVAARGGVGGIHHCAYQVFSVEETMKLWKDKGWVEFTSDKPMKCPGLVQCFTKPLETTGGVIFEFIERGEHGFCSANVKALMESTKGL